MAQQEKITQVTEDDIDEVFTDSGLIKKGFSVNAVSVFFLLKV